MKCKTNQKVKKFVAVMMALTMAITAFSVPVLAVPLDDYAQAEVQLSRAAEPLQVPMEYTLGAEVLDFLLHTLEQTPAGVIGFEGPYELPDNPNEMVDIVVQFRTPPAVALRLAQEVENPRARGLGRAMDTAFVPAALEAHSSFLNELNTIPVPFSADGNIEIVSEHHMLFNGVFMRVPVGMIESIALLPEVFAVTPAMVPHTLQDLEAMANGTFGAEPTTGTIYNHATLNSMIVDGVLVVPSDFQCYEYQWHPEFNQGARDLFELDHINNTMGITGAGIRVGIIDTGIDYRHPAYWHMLIPVADGAGFVRDESGQYWSLPGGNFLTSPVGGRAVGRNASPMEMIHGPTHSTHGTHVAGIALGTAPGIQLYAFRILSAEPGGGGLPQAPMLAIEYAYYLGLDVVNNSWGYVGNSNHPWYAFTFATNVAALAGQISTNATGNDGLGGFGVNNVPGNGGWFSLGGGASSASLGISVASGQGGNRHSLGLQDSFVNGIPAPTLALSGIPTWFDPFGDLPQGNLDYTWFGRLEVPTRAELDNSAFADAFVQSIRDDFLDGGDLYGQVAVFARGGGPFLSYHYLAYRLGAVATIITNNEEGPILNTTHNTPNPTDPPLVMPNFSMGLTEANMHFGEPLPVPNPPLRGTLDLGNIFHIPSPNLKTPSSSVGPLGPVSAGDSSQAIMHIFPSITAPGANIVSTFTISHPNSILGRPYHAQGGTSMAGPAVAGAIALMLEHFDGPLAESTRPGTRAVEMRARLMQSATPLDGYGGQYSVNQVGAGLMNPLGALQTTAFATTVHPVPFGHGVTMDDITYQVVGNHLRVFADHTMSSLSFGRVQTAEDEPVETPTLPVTIHGDGTWTFDRLEWHMPTQELRNPATGDWTGNWGPRLQHTVTGVDYSIVTTGHNTFNVYLTHDGLLDNRGFAQGHIFFTNNAGDELFMIFGAYFDVELPPPPPAELSVRNYTGIWRPVISGFVSPNHAGYDDPREFPAGWLSNPGLHIMTAQSNYSPVTFGFDDDSGTPRNVRFYIGPYGASLGDAEKLFHTQFANVTPGTNFFSGNLLRPMVGGSLFGITGQPSWQAGDGHLLSPGLHTLTMFIANPGGEDLVAPFHFVVTNDRPTITFDQDVFLYREGDTSVTITGRVNSLGHDLAIENDLVGMTAWAGTTYLLPGNTGLFDYSRTTVWLPAAPFTEFPVNPDGTFSFNMPATGNLTPTTLNLRATDGEGIGIVPNILGQWNSITFAAANQSALASFTFVMCDCDPCPDCGECMICGECQAFGLNIFNNGEGGTPSTPNASLAAGGTIRMWTQRGGVNAPVNLAARDTMVAIDQNGQCALEFVSISPMWVAGQGWANVFNQINVNKNAPWQRIYFSITVCGQTVDVVLVNALYEPTIPVFGLNMFNNGEGGSPSTPNASLAAAGTIRIWTQLDGAGAPVYLAATSTMVAIDQDGQCALAFVSASPMWVAGQGWADVFNQINVNKNAPWQYINFEITAYGQTIELLLVNSRFFGLNIFNNGPVELGATPSHPNESLAAAGIIRMWTQLSGQSTRVPYAQLTVAAELPDGSCAMAYITVHRSQDYVQSIDANKNALWERIYLTVTLFGQTIDVVLVNDSAPAFSLDIFNNGPVELGATPSRPNPSLAANGTIRMWTRLDNANARVPYAQLTVAAALSDGTCAMQFITINRPWNDQDNVQTIDTNKNLPWERIYLTVSWRGQTVDVVLVNSLYEPAELGYQEYSECSEYVECSEYPEYLEYLEYPEY